ncbi:MAG: hypothetical protein ACI4WW_03105 [Candidatus Coprovivens sp.]
MATKTSATKVKKNKSFIVLLLVLLLGITIGYASLATVLNINGSTHIIAPSWDIHFENVVEKTGSVTATTPATITSATNVAYEVTLKESKDYYEFNVDVVNGGSLDAKLDESILSGLTSNEEKYISYTVTYADGSEIKKNDYLDAGKHVTLKVRVEYDYSDITDESELPAENATLNLKYSMTYIQR